MRSLQTADDGQNEHWQLISVLFVDEENSEEILLELKILIIGSPQLLSGILTRVLCT
jgi:hypothetical protein